jgi:hypothetical protein
LNSLNFLGIQASLCLKFLETKNYLFVVGVPFKKTTFFSYFLLLGK